MKAIQIEEAVARHFNFRQNLIVPNLHWSLFRYELDVLVIRKSGWGVEVEIKVSKQDLKIDCLKRHHHNDNRIRELYFAVPENLYEACLEYAPPDAGIAVCCWYGKGSSSFAKIEIRRKAKLRKAVKFTAAETDYVARLGCMRIWNLKSKLCAKENRNES